MQKTSRKYGLLALLITLAAANAEATPIDHVYDISFDGTTYNETYSGDANLEVGGTLQLNFTAASNDYWVNMASGTFWSPIAIMPNANRVGDYSWSYLLDNVQVANGSDLNDASASIHVINFVASYAGMFDQLTITYLLTSSTTADVNELEAADTDGTFFDNVPFSAQYVDNASGVPEPTMLSLLGLGLLAMATRKRNAATRA